MEWFANLHYVFVHFPIALIVMAGIAELIMWIRKNNNLDQTVLFLLVSASFFILFTIATGLTLEEFGSSHEEHHAQLELHEAFAFTTLAFLFATLILRVWKGKNFLYFTSLTLLVVSVIITAHYGGEMVFGPISYFPSF